MEEIAAVVQTTPQVRGPERIAKQSVDTPGPPVMKEIAEVVQATPKERGPERFRISVARLGEEAPHRIFDLA